MRKTFLLMASLLPGFAQTVQADVITLPEPEASRMALPQRGMAQTAVLQQFGEPLRRHAPVGGGQPKQPPITRWDYEGWSVFFEHNIVIDAVVQGQPKPLQHVDELKTEP